MQPYEFKEDDAYRFARAIGAVTHRNGDELQFKYCPYCNGGPHHDKNTFSISLRTGAWNCKRGTCREEGNMIRLAQDFEEFSLGNAAVDDFYLKRERFKKFLRRPVESKDAAIEYLEKRGIPAEVTKRYEITIKKDADNVMVFPFVDDKNDLWFIKYRNIKFIKESSGSKEWCEKDRKPILFGMNHCNFDNKILVMTEGQIDSLSCAAAGIENAVSVPLGKNGFTWYPYCFNFLSRFDELIVFGDYENGEISLLDGMTTRFHGRVKHVRPEDYKDCKDANEILLKYGPEAVRECINNAVDVPVKGLTKMSEVHGIRLADLERMETGIAELDRKCTFYFGELIVLTGAAGEGKSTLASQWALKAADQGYSTLVYSGEMSPGTVKNWMDFQVVGPHNLNAQHDITDEVYQEVVSSGIYDNIYLYSLDDAESSQDKFLEVVVDGIQRYGIRFIVIDNLMTVMDYGGNMELYEAQTAYTKMLAKIAQDYNVIIVLIVHPRKRSQASFSNDDIAGSSNITNRAHKVIRYARPTKEFTDMDGVKWETDDLYDCPIRELTVLKDRLTGKTISKGIMLYFDEWTKRIAESKAFNWSMKWENKGFVPVDDLDEIPF